MNEYSYAWHRFKRNFALVFLGWHNPSKDYPSIGQRCKLFGLPGYWVYKYNPDAIPPFPSTEEEKRDWYLFVENGDDRNGCVMTAISVIWKPYK